MQRANSTHSAPSRTDLRRLAGDESGPHASLFIPTARAGRDRVNNPTRLANAGAQAETALEARGYEADVARGVIDPVQALASDGDFWSHPSDGLAVFAHAGEVEHYWLPFEPVERAVGADRHYIRPLLRLLDGDGRFYILALNQGEARLYRGSRHRIADQPIEALGVAPEQAFGRHEHQRTLQWHTGAPKHGGGKRDAMYHGQGGGIDDRQARLDRYCRLVSDSVKPVVAEAPGPLVLAAVDDLAATYRRVAHDADVMEDFIHGNPASLDATELHERAWTLVDSTLAKPRQRAAGRLMDALHHGGATNDVAEVVAAANDGRVQALFVTGEPVWGCFDAHTRRAERAPGPAAGVDDLLELAAARTLAHDGEIYTELPEGIAQDTQVAALLRF